MTDRTMREYVNAAPTCPISDEALATGLEDIIAQLGWYLAAANDNSAPIVDTVIITAEHAVRTLTVRGGDCQGP